MAQRVADALSAPRIAGRRGRHRHRQDLRLPGARRCCRGCACSFPPAPAPCRTSCSPRTCRWSAAALGRPARVALLKGRANYLCRYRLERTTRTASSWPWQACRPPRTRTAQAMLARIQRWARTTHAAILPRCAAFRTAIRCGRRSPRRARAVSAHAAGVLPLPRGAGAARSARGGHRHRQPSPAAGGSGAEGGRLRRPLGSADAVILDEAHQIPDLATQFFGAHVSSRQVETLLQDLRVGAGRTAPGTGGGAALAVCGALADVEDASRDLRAAAPPRGPLPLGAGCPALAARVRGLAASAVRARRRRSAVGRGQHRSRSSPSARRTWRASSTRIAATDDLEGARTLGVPVRAASSCTSCRLISRRGFRALVQARRGAWIFTSATLSRRRGFQPLHRPPGA